MEFIHDGPLQKESSLLLENLEIFTILKFGILFAKHPRDHLSCLHARTNNIAIFVPAMRAFFWSLDKQYRNKEHEKIQKIQCHH